MKRNRFGSRWRLVLSVAMATMLGTLGLVGSVSATPGSVDNVVDVIRGNVEASKWTTVSKNIEDLSRTIRNEVTVNKAVVVVGSNPVRAARQANDERLKLLQAEYAIFAAQYDQYLKAAKAGREQARTDIVGEMVTKLSKLLGGALAPIEFGKTRNTGIIAAELAQLKTLADLGRYIRQRQESLRPAIKEAQSTRTKLTGLEAQWNVVMRKYAGKITVAGATGAAPTSAPTATPPTKSPASGTYRNTFVFRIPESRRAYVGAFQADKNPIYWTGDMLLNGKVVASYDISSAGEATMTRTFDVDAAPGTKIDVSINNPKLNYGPMTLSVTTLSEAHTWDVWWFIDSIDVQMSK